MTKLAIIGSRTVTDYQLLCRTMDRWFAVPNTDRYLVEQVISGGAKGADSLAARWAKEHGVPLTEFIPDWDKHGRRAGFLRNEDIVAAADVVLALWARDEGGELSRGTGNSLSIAKRLKKTTLIVYP